MITLAKRGSGTLKHKLKERGHDLYETPVEATRALMALEKLPLAIWEPACGRGAIVQALRANGHEVYASDVEDYNWPHAAKIDFLMERRAPRLIIDKSFYDIDTIVTNPPFKLANEFISHGLKLCERVILLLEVKALASQGRIQMVNHHLARVYIFGRRLPTMHRDGWTGKKSSSDKDHAWFIFERNHSDPATIQSIDWKDYQ